MHRKKKDQVIILRLPAETKERITATAAERGATVSAVIREMIENITRKKKRDI